MCGTQREVVAAHCLRTPRRSSHRCLSTDQSALIYSRREHEQRDRKTVEQRSTNQSWTTQLVVSPAKNGSVDEAQLLARFAVLAHLPKMDMPIVHQLLAKTVTLLRACGYPLQDVCVILAHASVYYCDAIAANGREMDPNEVAHVLVALIFLAHSYVEDNTCPLNIWHQRLCKDYCNLKLLNTAVMQLMKMRRWCLRVGDRDLALRLNFLQSSGSSTLPTQIASSIGDVAPEVPQAPAPPASQLDTKTIRPADASRSARQQAAAAGAAAACAAAAAAAASARAYGSPTRDRMREAGLAPRSARGCSGPCVSTLPSAVPIPIPMAGLGGPLATATSYRGCPELSQPTAGISKIAPASYIATYASLHMGSHCSIMSSSSTRALSPYFWAASGSPTGRWPSEQVVCR